jgi:phosphoribosylformylglycinamidine cyclo-ligase
VALLGLDMAPKPFIRRMTDSGPSERRLRRRNPVLGEASEGAVEAPSEALTYREAGVDIEAGDEAVRRIGPLARATLRPEVLGGIGAFASFVRVPPGYAEPVLVSSTDGVGSKLKVAFQADRHDTVGIDLVAMGVNDVLVHGAEPLYFLDYIGTSRLDPARVEQLVAGVAEGCRRAGCALVGGETAELPDLYAAGEYDLAGFVVGIVERARIIDGTAVKPGDVVLGLASSGLHSNGYSLARRIVFEVMGLAIDAPLPGTGRSVADELLEPTRIYVRAILPVRDDVTAMAHVTGGGLTGNLPRVLPEGCRALVRPAAWAERRPPVFRTLQEAGRVEEAEMFRTFNMGIGYVVVTRPTLADSVGARLRAAGEEVVVIGEVVAGERGVELIR